MCGRCVLGHMARESVWIHHRYALTKKAWEDAVHSENTVKDRFSAATRMSAALE